MGDMGMMEIASKAHLTEVVLLGNRKRLKQADNPRKDPIRLKQKDQVRRNPR